MTSPRASLIRLLYSIVIVITVVPVGWFRSAELSAQVVGATVSGTAVDASGGVIPNVQVSVKNLATTIITNALTNGVGFYIAPNLPAGNYELTVSAAGFATLSFRARLARETS
jgi:Carboxypeptidase regulatory-like domain